MTEGIAMFCYDSDFAYSRICNFNIGQIKQYLNLPVTVYTDSNTKKHIKGADSIIETDVPAGNNRYFRPQSRSIPWYNLNRKDIFFDPPYDSTVVVDVDYVIMSDCILQLFGSNSDFLCYNSVRDATGMKSLEGSSIGHSDIDFCWATVMLVTRSDRCRRIGEMIGYIQKNYKYFMRLYRVSDANTYRNDYALSIALHQLNGFRSANCFIPGKLVTLPDQVYTKVVDGEVYFEFDRDNDKIYSRLRETDTHILNKEAVYA